MESFSEAVPKVASDDTEHFQKVADHFMEVIKDPHSTTADVEAVFTEFETACKESGSTSAEAAKKEIKEHAMRLINALGTTEEEAEELCEEATGGEVKRIVELAKKQVRDAAPRVIQATPKAAKWLWLKLAGGLVAAGLVSVAIRTGSSVYIPQEPPGFDPIQIQIEVRLSNTQQMSELLRGLNVDNIPSVNLPEQAHVALPEAVARVADMPVTARIETATVSKTATTSLGQVYSSVPESRQQIEDRAARSQHEFHGKIDVTGPFDGGGSVNLSW